MARNSLDFRPATVDVYARPGSDITWRVSVSDEGITAGTITCTVGGQTPSVDTSLSATGLLICDITLTDTQTTALGATSVSWSLSNTVAGVTTCYVTGAYTGSTTGNASNGLNASVVATTGHAAVQTLVSTSAATALAAHIADTTDVHGIEYRNSGGTGVLTLGPNAGANINTVTTYGNLAIGKDAMSDNVSSSGNVAIGFQSMRDMVSGGDQTAVGTYTLRNHLGATGNTAIGFRAMELGTQGGNNTAVGDSALWSLNGATADGNTAIGYVVMENVVNATRCMALGSGALYQAVNPEDVVAIGHAAMYYGTGTPSRSVAIGSRALSVSTATDCVAVGHAAMELNTTGIRMTVVGADAGNVNTTGFGNTYIGWGSGSSGTLATANRSTAIGYLALATKSDQMVLGGSTVTETLMRGLVCIDGNTVSFPALKRSGTTIQARTATDSTFARFQGELQTSANAVAGGGLTPTHTIVIYDAAGQAYRVPCLV